MALHLHITGIVQGVGYRASFEHEARRMGLSGWVRNRRDGSVEALIAGSAEAVEAMRQWARHGPPSARVSGVVANESDGADVGSGFHVLPTL